MALCALLLICRFCHINPTDYCLLTTFLLKVEFTKPFKGTNIRGFAVMTKQTAVFFNQLLLITF